MKKVLVGLTMFAVASASAAITSRSYVPTGLVAQYDGIDNAGFGTHNPSAATWVNLTGDTALDGTVDSHVTWGADGWSVTENCKPITLGNGISAVTATGEFTIQFACTPYKGQNGSGGRQCFFSQYKSGVNGIGIEHNGVVNKNELRLYSSPVDGSAYSTSDPLATNVWVQGSVTASDGLTDIGFWKNGSKMSSAATKTFTKKTYASSCTSIIGGEPNTGRDMAFRGIYNAFRIYDRVLTEVELKINAAVDAIRFNGANWNDYPELAAYSFAADGTLQYSIGVEAATGGAVRLDDGAAAATASAPFDYDGTAHSATFTAVPDSGYVFYRWEGDTDDIVSGTIVTPTVTVTADKVARLVATFRAQPSVFSSRSYVQDGLVAQYDGINNVSHDDVHNRTATEWADLTGNGANGTCAASSVFSWGDNGWSVSDSCQPVTVSSCNLSQTIATGTFTLQFACTPDTPGNTQSRQCFFGQYNGEPGDFNVEQTAANKLRLYHYAIGSVSTYDWASSGTDYIGVDRFFSVAYTMAINSGALFVDGSKRETKSASFVTAHTNVTSIIGGERSRPAFAFRGTYNAFRLYNRVLTDEENMHNSLVDAVRFTNGASLPAGYVVGGDGTLKVTVSATATAGGKVSIRGGAAASSVSTNVDKFGSDYTYLEAFPEEGYVFDRWTGDTAAITEGHPVAARIAVGPSAPVTLTAVFRKPGNALDGMIFDLDIRDVEDGTPMSESNSGYHVGDGLKAGSPSSNTYYTCLYTGYSFESGHRPMYRFKDIPTPITPFTTNAAQPCIYMPQTMGDGGNCNVARWELPNNYVDWPVATFYVRFLWEGPLVPGIANDSCILCNGYTTWANVGEGFGLRIRTASGGGDNDNKGYLNVFVPKKEPTVDYGTSPYITTNCWVDCFASVYPSPTNVELSNVDIWFCQTPALGSNGIFGLPVLKHRHLGDECNLPRFRAIDKGHAIRLGAESSGAADDPEKIRKAFRGYYGGLKAWNRILTENEMWSVMAGQYGGTFNVGVENGSADEFGGTWYETSDPFNVATDKWQRMKKSLTAADRTLTLVAPIPAESDGMPRVLEIVPLFDGVGASCPVTVTANGAMIGEFDLMDESKRAIPLRAGQVRRDANGKLTIAITRPEGCEGTLSFDALSLAGSWQIGTIDGTSGDMTQQGQGVSSVVIAGDPNYKHAQRAVTTTYNTLTIPFDVPKSSAGQCAYRYETSIDSVKSGNTHPIHLELNGETVWSSANAATGKVRVEIPAEDIKAGLNELKWVYDTTTASNWLTFDYHRMKMVVPTGTVFIIR